jgi:drug/metabolite transporter (DMT)-like permease
VLSVQSTHSISQNRQFMLGCLFVLLAATGFSAKSILVKLVYGIAPEIDAITLMLWRMVLALPFFLGAALWSLRQYNVSCYSLNRADWLGITALGFIGYYLSSLLDFEGLAYISASLERLILYLYPTFVVLMTAFYSRKTVSRRQMFALFLSYAGVVLVYVNTKWQAGSPALWLGSALVAASALSFAIFMMASAAAIKRIGAVRFTAYSMTVACMLTIIHFTLKHGFPVPGLPLQVYVLTGIMALCSTVIPSFLMSAGVQRIGADSASILSSVGPIGTLIMAFFILGEPLTLVQSIGTVLILTGVYSVNHRKHG